MMLKEISCCFTGHRKIPKDKLDQIKQSVRHEIDRAYVRGYRRFLCGGALGFDTLCAQTVIEKKAECSDAMLILVLPCMGQDEQWSEDEQRVYREIYAKADECYCMSELYTEGCMQTRNRAMVNDSTLCIAYLENDKSGTAYTYFYAQKNGVETVNIATDAKLTLRSMEEEGEQENEQ